MGQAMNKFKKGEGETPKEPKGLVDILEKKYEEDFKKVNTFEEFHRQLYLVVEKLNEESGAMQFKLPSQADLGKSFSNHMESKTALGKEQFKKIIKEVVRVDAFNIGQGAIDVLLFLFGIPIVAYYAKRVIPGGQSVSDDVIIPAATSATVFILTKTNRL